MTSYDQVTIKDLAEVPLMPVLPFPTSPTSECVLLGFKRRLPLLQSTLLQQESWQRVRLGIHELELLNPDAGPLLESLFADLIGDCRR